jgi:hypothetical protein
MDNLSELQRAIRDFDAWLRVRLPKYSAEQDSYSMARAIPKTMLKYALRRMDQIDRIRNKVLNDVNSLLKIADERPLPLITPSSRRASRLFGPQGT